MAQLLCPYESGNNETICAGSLPIVVFNMLSRANNSALVGNFITAYYDLVPSTLCPSLVNSRQKKNAKTGGYSLRGQAFFFVKNLICFLQLCGEEGAVH